MRLIALLLIILLASCNNSKQVIAPASSIQTPTHLQPDTCLTDKQLKQYYNFVKDSLKIELRRDRQIRKKENDSLKIELKMLKSDNSVIKYVTRFDTKRFNDSITKITQMYSDSLKVAKVVVKEENKTVRTEVRQDNKTDRTDTRQENKTERAKLNRWLIFFIGLVVGVLSRYVVRLVKLLV